MANFPTVLEVRSLHLGVSSIISSEVFLLGLQMAIFSCLHMVFPLCLSRYSSKSTSHIELATRTPRNDLSLNCFLKGLISNYSGIVRYWGLAVQHMNLGVGVGDINQTITIAKLQTVQYYGYYLSLLRL